MSLRINMKETENNQPLLKPFLLPCGVTIKNRIVKAATTERLSDKTGLPNSLHLNLYGKWSDSGAGLIISGNILIDKRFKESSGNIVIESEKAIPHLLKWTTQATRGGNQFWAQINHSGRQTTIFSNFNPIAPSEVKLKKNGLFSKPKAMTLEQVKDVEQQFINSAVICKQGGFTGVQIHAAHGYLISQFLSPVTNLRTDEYGGSVENRSRFLLNIVKGVRAQIGKDFPVSVKLNSADFQKGGFSENDAMYVVKKLEALGIDLLEISGGTYENIVFLDKSFEKESTKKREAYFMSFASEIRKQSNIPLLVTGGFRTLEFCESVLKNKELDLIGFARPFLLDERFPSIFINKENTKLEDVSLSFNPKSLSSFAEAGFYDYQIARIAQNKSINLNYSPYNALVRLIKNEMVKGWL